MRWTVLGIASLSLSLACGDSGSSADEDSTGTSAGTSTESTSTESGDGDGDGDGDSYWEPATAYPTPEQPGPRGFLDRRGLIHMHSVYSHDACDENPLDAMGNINQDCFDDLRAGMCAVQHDFIMLTDHRESYTDFEYPDLLLYTPSLGDTLVTRDGIDAASWASCGESSRPTLITAGCEAPGAMMPVGIDGHLAPTPSERSSILGDLTQENADLIHEHGGVILLAHTEERTPQELADLPLDGFEAYNVHANLFANLLGAAELLELLDTPELLPHSDLVLAPLFTEDPSYVDTWGTTLALGAKRVVTLGTDAHRNTLPQMLPDGERIDSFRRMMKWFSNHILVRPDEDGLWDDVELEDGLRAGRLWGAFDYLGYPQGFDAYVTSAAGTHEIGSTLALADGPQLQVSAPRVQGLDPELDAPIIEIRVLRAVDGGWESLLSSEEDLVDFSIDELGVYRVEIRIVPRHLRAWLEPTYGDLADADFPWIYANPFYVE